MTASKDEYLKEAAKTIFRMSADEKIRKRCRNREEYYQDLRNYERKKARVTEEKERAVRDYEKAVTEYECGRKAQTDEIARLRAGIER